MRHHYILLASIHKSLAIVLYMKLQQNTYDIPDFVSFHTVLLQTQSMSKPVIQINSSSLKSSGSYTVKMKFYTSKTYHLVYWIYPCHVATYQCNMHVVVNSTTVGTPHKFKRYHNFFFFVMT